MTTDPQAFTITLPVPTPYRVEPARLVAWLSGRGWIHCADPGGPSWTCYTKDERIVFIPIGKSHSDYARALCDAVCDAAAIEGMQAHTLAALLAPPVEGPALQWAHASTAVRAPVLALLDGPAADQRRLAAALRGGGYAEAALEAEGRAMGLEAAAAVLRGSR